MLMRIRKYTLGYLIPSQQIYNLNYKRKTFEQILIITDQNLVNEDLTSHSKFKNTIMH